MPDQMTRILPLLAALGVDVEAALGFKTDLTNGEWYNVGTNCWASSATPTEIKAAAFELEGMMNKRGVRVLWRKVSGVWSVFMGDYPIGVSHPDRIEADILAGTKVAEGLG